jgi:hypothetical protein
MLVADWSGASLRWEQELTGLKQRLSGALGRPEPSRSSSRAADRDTAHAPLNPSLIQSRVVIIQVPNNC